MIHNLLEDLYLLLRDARAVATAADEAGDRGAANLLDRIAETTEKDT